MYNQDVSGWWVKVLVTAMRTMANTMVMMTREKMPPMMNFFRSDICTRQSMVIGIDITIAVSGIALEALSSWLASHS